VEKFQHRRHTLPEKYRKSTTLKMVTWNCHTNKYEFSKKDFQPTYPWAHEWGKLWRRPQWGRKWCARLRSGT